MQNAGCPADDGCADFIYALLTRVTSHMKLGTLPDRQLCMPCTGTSHLECNPCAVLTCGDIKNCPSDGKVHRLAWTGAIMLTQLCEGHLLGKYYLYTVCCPQQWL